jgi:hypothetical protein
MENLFPVMVAGGPAGGGSTISGRSNPRLWWNAAIYSRSLPFVHLETGLSPEDGAAGDLVHYGNHLKPGSCEDIGLDACAEDPAALDAWLAMIAREALDMGLLPGIQHARIPRGAVEGRWPAGVLASGAEAVRPLLDYPFNGLFSHPASEAPPVTRRLARAI